MAIARPNLIEYFALSDSTSREPRGSATPVWGVDAVVMLGRASAYLDRPVLVNLYLVSVASRLGRAVVADGGVSLVPQPAS